VPNKRLALGAGADVLVAVEVATGLVVVAVCVGATDTFGFSRTMTAIVVTKAAISISPAIVLDLMFINHQPLETLKASQIPSTPPTAVNITEENDIKPAPQRLGIRPPSVEPMTMPIQIKRFDSMLTL